MRPNLRTTFLALAAGGAALAGLGQSAPIESARAQAASSLTQAKPCDPSADGSDQSECKSNGVIRPPATGDQGGVISPPPKSKSMPMPVIPPPGTPGGDSTVLPK